MSKCKLCSELFMLVHLTWSQTSLWGILFLFLSSANQTFNTQYASNLCRLGKNFIVKTSLVDRESLKKEEKTHIPKPVLFDDS